MQQNNQQTNNARYRIVKGIYYWATQRDAREYARLIAPRVWQIVQYAQGWAIQREKDGPCWGPGGWRDLPEKQVALRIGLEDQQPNDIHWRIVKRWKGLQGYAELTNRSYVNHAEAVRDAAELSNELGERWDCFPVCIER